MAVASFGGMAPFLAVAAVEGPARMVWTAALLSWIAAVPLWWVTKFVLVIAHEGGHALLAKVLFQKLKEISFDRQGGGLTAPADKVPWLFNIFFFLGGYLGPSMFGLLGAWLLVHGRTVEVLWASVAFLVVMLFAVRGFLGWLLVPGLIALIWLIATRVDPPLQTLYTHMWVWFLLIGAVQRMLLLVWRQDYLNPQNDMSVMQRLTLMPREVWSFLCLLATTAALVYGGAMLLRIGA